METIKLAEKYKDEMIRTRRTIHMNPELSNREFETTALIKEKMAEFGIETVDIGMNTGVIGIIRGGKPGKTIGIREDIDALPMPEETGLPFSSKNEGVCHSCGHDIHTTTLIYVGKILNEIKDELCGNVMLIFQPAEEGGGGASQMEAHKYYEVMRPDMYIGLHVSPAIPVGSIGVKYGASGGSADTFNITVTGVGGHGAHPENFVSPVTIAAYLITQMETILARENDPRKPAVLTVGSIHGGTKGNIVPDQVVMQGTMRTLDAQLRTDMKAALKRIVEGCCATMRGKGVLEWESDGVPVLYNDETVTQCIYDAAAKVIGEDHIVIGKQPSMGSEDFSVFFDYGPGAQFSLGTQTPGKPETAYGIHNARNVFDEDCLPVGVAVIVQAARDFLK
ncbi:MAG: amidohydrolase [Firmicutes bacterium]|nr:amidohydrolase [Bacillota bacterium]